MSNSTRLLLPRARTFPNGKLDRKNLLSNQASNYFPASQVSTSQFSGRRLSNLNLASRSASPYSTHPTPSSSSIPPPQSLSKDSNKHNSRSLRLLKPKNLSQTDAKIDGIKITPSAVEQIERVRRKDKRPGEVLRLSVESGGCHGFQYKMEFTESIEDDDLMFATGDEESCLVVIDQSSVDLVQGSTIDFHTELIGSSFKILDNPQSSGKGCGCGVSWELKI